MRPSDIARLRQQARELRMLVEQQQDHGAGLKLDQADALIERTHRTAYCPTVQTTFAIQELLATLAQNPKK